MKLTVVSHTGYTSSIKVDCNSVIIKKGSETNAEFPKLANFTDGVLLMIANEEEERKFSEFIKKYLNKD